MFIGLFIKKFIFGEEKNNSMNRKKNLDSDFTYGVCGVFSVSNEFIDKAFFL